jgi:hypothetical protein
MTRPLLTLPSSPSISWRNTNGCQSPYPTYSSDLAACDFFLFSKLKLEGRRFDPVEEIQGEWQTVLDSVTEKNYQKAFQI